MIKEKPNEITIDLTGPDGNAFTLIGHARNWNKQLGYSNEEITQFTGKLMDGSYSNLLRLMDERFGSFVTFYK